MSSPAATTPPAHAGMRHVALNCHALEACVAFYTELLGMTVEWNPDPDNFYLTSGNDNLALHRAEAATGFQRLDHIGFILNRMADVDLWHARLVEAGVPIVKPPKTHRDGARSLYCLDPDGTTVQMIYHPPLAPTQTR